jgi:hypothetical protein
MVFELLVSSRSLLSIHLLARLQSELEVELILLVSIFVLFNICCSFLLYIEIMYLFSKNKLYFSDFPFC